MKARRGEYGFDARLAAAVVRRGTAAMRGDLVGVAMGIDLGSVKDQSGNALEATQRNAAAEGVSVELHTADMRKLPFPDASFEVIVGGPWAATSLVTGVC